jgi:hypothetical protein
MNIKEIGYEDVDWIHLSQDGIQWWVFVNTVINLRVPKMATNLLTS